LDDHQVVRQNACYFHLISCHGGVVYGRGHNSLSVDDLLASSWFTYSLLSIMTRSGQFNIPRRLYTRVCFYPDPDNKVLSGWHLCIPTLRRFTVSSHPPNLFGCQRQQFR
jgi:hypothetical protein